MRAELRGRGGRALGAAVLLALLGLLAGCASIPTSGAVVEGGPVRIDEPEPYVARIPARPLNGDREAVLVQRWFEAMSAYQPGYPTASLFLSDKAGARWRSEAGITVYDGRSGVEPRLLSPGEVRAELSVLARIDPDGVYRRVRPGTRETVDLHLVRQSGQWRIDDPPRGVYMSEFDVQRELAPYDVYFPSPDGQVLVPQPLYLPVRGALTTLLVDALLRGAPSDLVPAVSTAFPADAALTGPGVPVEGGVAQVGLAIGAADVVVAQRDLMSAQLVWTLGQLPTVSGVRLTLDGVPVVAGGGSPNGVQPRTAWQRFDPAVTADHEDLYAISGRRVVQLTGGRARSVRGPLGRIGARVRSVAVDRSDAAAVTVDGTTLLTAGLTDQAALRERLTGGDLATPAYDRLDRVWVVDRATGRLRVLGPRADARALDVPVLTAAGVRLPGALRKVVVSRDGARVALLVLRGGALRLYVGIVVGGSGDRPLSVSIVDELTRVRDVVDVAWADPLLLAVLQRGSAGEAPVALVDITGATLEARGSVPDGVTVAAAPRQPVVVASSGGQLSRLDAAQQWTPAGAGSQPAYPR